MNNYLLQNKENSKEEKGNDAEKELLEAQKILEAVIELKENRHYQELKRLIFEPFAQMVQHRIERNVKDLVNDVDGKIVREILKDQGILYAYKKLTDFESLENEERSLTENYKRIIKNGN